MPASRRVLLVGWDAADWKVIRPLMEAGEMPTVQRLVSGGSSGHIATLHPPLSPMLWTSIATGQRPFRHGIHGFTEPAPDGSGVRPVTNLSRKSKALWNILNQNGLCSVVVGWWPSHPAEPINGVMVSDRFHRAHRPLEEGWPMPANAVHPPEFAENLANLRVHPDHLTPRMVERFIPLAVEIDQDRDQRLAAFLRTLAECMSIQAAAEWLLDHQPWDFFAVYFEAIDHFSHSFMRYHPPRQEWISERDFELYRNVVSMAYRLHDEMLGRLLAKAGEDTTVILLSDHGFHPDALRPSSIPNVPAGPAVEHRDYGVLALAGPGIAKKQTLHGAFLLDIAPTVLTLYGLPVGGDMDGKVLSQAFVNPPRISFVPSWEEIPGADGRHPPHTLLDPVAAHEALEQMIALGYVERPDANREIAVAKTVQELRYNLGESYQDAGRHAEAYEILTELRKADPEDRRFSVRLFASCQALGLHGEMRRIAEQIDGQTPLADYLNAQVSMAEGRYADALALLERVPGQSLEIAGLYLRLGRMPEAQQTYAKVLEADPDNAQAHLGLCRIALRRRSYRAAAHAALDALQRTHHDPTAHFLLGRSLAGMKEYERAAEAFRAAISFNPNFPEAHVRLAALLEKQFGRNEEAREHRRLARSMSKSPGKRWAEAEPPRPHHAPIAAAPVDMPTLPETLIVVTGLPRSGTSLLMQMLAAGGIPVVADEARQPDEDNPRGYLEFEPVKKLLKDSSWLFEARGKAIKIVAPLLVALPASLACRVILCERNLDEVLDSQDRMLLHRDQPLSTTPQRRQLLKEEYARTLIRVKTMLARRPKTQLLVLQYGQAISNPRGAAEQINRFLGGGLDVANMASAVDPSLYRNRAG